MRTFDDDDFRQAIHDEVGIEPEWAAVSFGDLDEDVRRSISLIMESPFIPRKDSVRGFVYDVSTGALRGSHLSVIGHPSPTPGSPP